MCSVACKLAVNCPSQQMTMKRPLPPLPNRYSRTLPPYSPPNPPPHPPPLHPHTKHPLPPPPQPLPLPMLPPPPPPPLLPLVSSECLLVRALPLRLRWWSLPTSQSRALRLRTRLHASPLRVWWRWATARVKMTTAAAAQSCRDCNPNPALRVAVRRAAPIADPHRTLRRAALHRVRQRTVKKTSKDWM